MLLFRSEELAWQWCDRKRTARGEILTPRQIWELSKLWYQDRLSVDYHGRTPEQAAEIFRQAGLESAFWDAARS